MNTQNTDFTQNESIDESDYDYTQHDVFSSINFDYHIQVKSDDPRIVEVQNMLVDNAGLTPIHTKSNNVSKTDIYKSANCVLANLLKNTMNDSRVMTSISLSKNSWSYSKFPTTNDVEKNPFRLELSKTSKLLKGSPNIIYFKKGFNPRKGSDQKPERTKIALKKKFLTILQQCDYEIVHILKDRELVVVRDDNNDDIEFTPTPLTLSNIALIEAYNEAQKAWKTTYQGDATHVTFRAKDGKTRAVNLSDNRLKIVHSRSSQEANGRMDSRGLQSCPKSLRQDTYVTWMQDGVETTDKLIQLDFSGMFLSLIATEEDFVIEGDPYSIDWPDELDVWHKIYEKNEKGKWAENKEKSWTYNLGPKRDKILRVIVKKAFNTASNCPTDDKLGVSISGAIKEEFGFSPISLTNDIVEFIFDELEKKIPFIRKYIGDDAGVRYMFKESEIARYVMRQLLKDNIPNFVIHDCFAVPFRYHNYVHSIMIDGFRAVMKIEDERLIENAKIEIE